MSLSNKAAYAVGGILLMLCATDAMAQQSTAMGTVVAACGTPPNTYTAGTQRPVTQNTSGVLCTSSGGGVGSDVNITGINGVAPSVGNGATDTGTQRVTLSNDSTGVVSVPGVATAANQSTANGYLSNIDGAIGDPIPAGTNLIGKVGIDQTTPGTTNGVSLVPVTAGGTTSYGLQSAASTNSTSVKASAGVVTAMNLINTTTTIYYLRMYNASSAPTCSSATNFVRTWPVPPAAAAGGAGGIAVNLGAYGSSFSTGIAFCLTGGPSSTDNTNAATGVFVNIDYK